MSLSIHVVLTKYHLDQKLFCARFFLFQNSLNNIIAAFHFIFQITPATEYFGGISITICALKEVPLG
jgi:hypothetical protein